MDQCNTLGAHVGVYVLHTIKLSVKVKVTVGKTAAVEDSLLALKSIMLLLLSSIQASV
jgi:hypothetical protein